MTNTVDKTSPSNGDPTCQQDESAIHSSYAQRRGAVEDDTRRAQETLSDEARSFKEDNQERMRSQTEAAGERGADAIEKFAHTMDTMASSLGQENWQGLATYATDLSAQMSRFASQLREHSPEQLAAEARSLARDNPTAFLLGSIALGFGLSRFFTASTAQSDHATTDSAHDEGTTPHSVSASDTDDGSANSTGSNGPLGSSADRRQL